MIGIGLDIPTSAILGRAGTNNVPNLTFNWVAEGDSITIGLGGTPAWPFAALGTMPGATPSTPGTNTPTSTSLTGGATVNLNDIATSGISALTIRDNYSTRGGAAFDGAKNINIFSIMAGTNTSGVNDTTPQQKYLILRTILRKARVTGYQRKVIGTITARDDNPAFWTGTLVPLNSYIAAYWNSDLDCDGLINFSGDARFGSAAAADDLTYYGADKLHPNVAGEAAMGSIAKSVMISALQGAGTRVNAPATWSIFDYGTSYLTLSNANRTVAWSTTGFTDAAFRGFIGKRSGKWYWETVFDNIGSAIVGIINENFDATLQVNNLQGTVNAMGYGAASAYGTQNIRGNSVVLASMSGASVNGDVIRHALDLDNGSYWMAINGGNWNNSASNNPSTNVGGASTSVLTANGTGGLIYPAGEIHTNGGQVTSRFALAEQSFSVPSGFKALDQ
ncbi:hypothetical protein [Bradyrhizobium sp. 76]|uniref:hypothetical protein n=1 Tax=Bradyrhizobium sp. 76 TaxID=2782680 RepID=UPI001FFB5CEA|nr:hypothetical protein [Bradyrhizobium sp. 76]MCK1407662.1 hypothetical protein [Bradyrhizobium sp. 76]